MVATKPKLHFRLIYLQITKADTNDLVKRWRNLGNIPKVDNLTFTAEVFSSGKAIEIDCVGEILPPLKKQPLISSELKAYPGVMDIVDSFEGGKRELKLKIKDSARSLNLSAQDQPPKLGKRSMAKRYSDYNVVVKI